MTAVPGQTSSPPSLDNRLLDLRSVRHPASAGACLDERCRSWPSWNGRRWPCAWPPAREGRNRQRPPDPRRCRVAWRDRNTGARNIGASGAWLGDALPHEVRSLSPRKCAAPIARSGIVSGTGLKRPEPGPSFGKWPDHRSATLRHHPRSFSLR